MLPYFPNIYPGELLYSVLARYVKHTGFPPDTLVNIELFGKKYAIPSFDLPFGLAQLALLMPNKHYTFPKGYLNNSHYLSTSSDLLYRMLQIKLLVPS